jgi:hypothetical protein
MHTLLCLNAAVLLRLPRAPQVMRQDVLHASSCGAHGVVLGMLRADGSVDADRLRPFVELCSALGGAAADTAALPWWAAG